MKDVALIPVLAGIMLALTVIAALIGAADASDPFPETAQARSSMAALSRP